MIRTVECGSRVPEYEERGPEDPSYLSSLGGSSQSPRVLVHAVVLRGVAYAAGAGAPILLEDDDPQAAEAARKSIVSRAERSPKVQQRALELLKVSAAV